MSVNKVGIYKSTDAGAPTWTGQTSSGIPVLTAVLINGYNSGSCTITRSGSTATAHRVGHGFNNITVGGVAGYCDQLIQVAGAGESEYNQFTRITVLDADNFTFQVSGTPDTPGTGAITCKVAPAGGGWTVPFTNSTTQAIYKQPGGNGLYLNVDDATAQQLNWRGYETASGVANAAGTFFSGAGSGPFPALAQMANGGVVRKSSANDATTRPWVIATTDRHVYVFVNDTNTTPLLASNGVGIFGDLVSTKPGDGYATIIIGASSNSGVDANFASFTARTWAAVIAGHYAARSFSQTGTSITLGKSALMPFCYGQNVDNQIMGGGGATLVYPHQTDGGAYGSEIIVGEVANSAFRGFLPGLWIPLHNRPLTHMDVYAGAAGTNQAGKKFLVHNLIGSGQVHIETSDTWRTAPYA